MGSWGPALFSDDLACDARDSYREMIEDGVEDDDATARMLERFAGTLDDPDEGPVFWIALAFTQSKIGRLNTAIRDRALQAIDNGEGLHLWEDDAGLLTKRKAALQKAREQLIGPQPDRKKLRPPSRRVTDLKPGDVLAYEASSRFALFRVARLNDSRVAVAPILVALHYNGADLPEPGRLRRLRDRRAPQLRPTKSGRAPWWAVSFHVMTIKKVTHADAGFVKVGQVRSKKGDGARRPGTYVDWTVLSGLLDAWLAEDGR
ncbi:MAG: hypothetical protein P1T08_14255 [Acidimicrobiia bacterium]|nr:hypothetical protein [Acidimicrobiia bacterium]